MTTDIDAFKSTVTGGAGLAMANMFLVQLPVSIPGIPNINSRTLNILCKSVQFPGRQVTSTEKIIGPKAVKHAYGILEDDVTMNFQVLNDYKIKNGYKKRGSLDCFVTDLPRQFEKLGRIFLGESINEPQLVDGF